MPSSAWDGAHRGNVGLDFETCESAKVLSSDFCNRIRLHIYLKSNLINVYLVYQVILFPLFCRELIYIPPAFRPYASQEGTTLKLAFPEKRHVRAEFVKPRAIQTLLLFF